MSPETTESLHVKCPTFLSFLTKFGLSQQIIIKKALNNKFTEIRLSRSRADKCDRRDTSKAVGAFRDYANDPKKHRIKLQSWLCSVSRQESLWPQQSSLHISLAAAAVYRCDVTATIWLYRPPRYLGLFAVSSSDLLPGLSHWVAPLYDLTPRTLPQKMLKRYVPISCTAIKVNFW